jgi:homoserine O-acetyltransferase
VKIHLGVMLMLCLTFAGLVARAADYPAPQAENFIVKDFQFKSGERLTEVKLHYYTLGAPQKDASGTVRNAVLILHGTGGSGRQFLTPTFAGVLFGPGQLLDATRYFIILPDDVGCSLLCRREDSDFSCLCSLAPHRQK